MNKLKKDFIKLSSEERLYGLHCPVVGLTGGIASGKSTVSRLLEKHGLKILDADQMVKNIYKTNEARDFIRTKFPEAWVLNEISFPKLREIFFNNADSKKIIEDFIYTRLKDEFSVASQAMTEQSFILYDVPLLFEKGLDQKVDLSIVVYASKEEQLKRLLKRDGCSQEVAEKILSEQMDIEIKKSKADIVISNMADEINLEAEVNKLLLQILD